MTLKKIGILLCLALSLSISASAVCSNATLVGSYGFTVTGVNGSGSLTAAVGLLTADGKGNLTGVETVSDAGVISSNVALTGTYSVKSTCIGAAAVSDGTSTANFNISVVTAGAQFEITRIDSGTSQYGYAMAQGKAVCTKAGMKGTFGFRGGGFSSSLSPYAWAGQIKLDGVGGVTGTETASFGGTIQTYSLPGTYSVNSNCTGTATFAGTNPSNVFFVIVNAGKSAMQIEADASVVTTSFIQK